MDIVKDTKIVMLPIERLVSNDGQIPGVPKNPRVISDERFRALVRRLKKSNLTGVIPLKVYEQDGVFVVLSGNQRLKALRQLKAAEVPCIIVPKDADAETLREIVVLENVNDGEWDGLENWNADELQEWGVDLPEEEELIDVEELLIEHASGEEAVKEYSQDTNYDLQRLYRSKCNEEIVRKIAEGEKSGEIRPEIAEVLKCRATQCTVFNFDELCKFYRSEDCTQAERELLRRLYLVFVCPKELFDAGILRIKELSNYIYDDELLTKTEAD